MSQPSPGRRARRHATPGVRGLAAFLLAAVVVALAPGTAAQEPSANASLVAAAQAGDPAGMARALAAGATPNARNRRGESALLIALKNDRTDLALQMLAAGSDVNLAAANGVTPLMAAAHGGYADIASTLLDKGADVNAVDQLRKTAMIYAAGQGHSDVVLLLIHAGVDPNALYDHELTALMWAAGYGHDDTVRVLLDAGANAGLKDDRGKSARDIAREEHFPATAKLLDAAVRN
jgi:ankyrin repeat protein